MAHDDIDGDLGVSRRQLIKRGAVVGGTVLWAAPVVQSLTTPALGQTTLYAPPCDTCGTPAAFALQALGVTLGGAQDATAGDGATCTCVVKAKADVVAALTASADAEILCGKANKDDCTASSYVAGLVVNLGSASDESTAYLEASALSSCVANGTGASRVAGAELQLVLRDAVGTVVGTAAVTVTAGCNSGVDLTPALNTLGVTLLNPVAVYFNEQACNNGELTVNALRVTVSSLTVTVAQARAGGPGCVCTPCATNPACTPPTSKIC